MRDDRGMRRARIPPDVTRGCGAVLSSRARPAIALAREARRDRGRVGPAVPTSRAITSVSSTTELSRPGSDGPAGSPRSHRSIFRVSGICVDRHRQSAAEWAARIPPAEPPTRRRLRGASLPQIRRHRATNHLVGGRLGGPDRARGRAPFRRQPAHLLRVAAEARASRAARSPAECLAPLGRRAVVPAG